MASPIRRTRFPEPPTTVALEDAEALRRNEAEAFVRNAFQAAYGARITHFMPTLMTLRNDTDTLLAVLGLRVVDEDSCFLEQYLDISIERHLANATGHAIARTSLVEVGNFAVGAAGGGRWLITALTAYLHAAGAAWAVFTCGPELRNAFRRLGVELVDLLQADASRLCDTERARWGRYYDQRPRVMAANVEQSYAVLSALFERECALNALWRHAGQTGRLVA